MEPSPHGSLEKPAQAALVLRAIRGRRARQKPFARDLLARTTAGRQTAGAGVDLVLLDAGWRPPRRWNGLAALPRRHDAAPHGRSEPAARRGRAERTRPVESHPHSGD